MIAESMEPMHQQIAHEEPVNHHGNIVAYQHGSNELGRFLGKFGQYFGNKIVLFLFDFKVDFIGGNKSYFHTGEKGGKDQTQYDYSDFHVLRFIVALFKFFGKISSEKEQKYTGCG